jgi:hypothetical protein
MADVNIKASITVDTGDTASKVQGVQDGMEKAGKSIQDTGNKTKDASGNFGKLKEGLGNLPGPIGSVVSAFDGLKKAFIAIIMNPVGLVLAAIVATLGLLYAAFTNTFAGGQKVEQIFAGIKATAQSLLDNLDKVGSAIKNVFTFNFSAAKKDLQDIGNAAVDAYSKMANLTKTAQDLKKEQLQNDLDGAERAKKLAILREQASDETIPAAKRKAALLELRKDAEQNAKDDIELAKKVTENEIARLTLQKDGAKKNQEEINKLKIDQINVETDNANELRRIAKQITAIEKAEQQKRNEDAKEARRIREEARKEEEKKLEDEAAAAKKRRDDLSKSQEDIEKEQAATKKKNDEDFQNRLVARGQTTIAVAEQTLQANNAIAQSDYAVSKAKEAQQEAQKELAMQSLDIISGMVDKNSVAGKSIAVATAVMNTYEGASKAIAQGGVFGPIAAAATIAAGMLNVKKIVSTKIPSAKGGGNVADGTTPSLSASAPISPIQMGTQLNQASIQGIGNAAAGGVNRAFILEADINNSNERQVRLQRAARLG